MSEQQNHNIDDLFKKGLEDHKAPFDESGWEGMEALLNTQVPPIDAFVKKSLQTPQDIEFDSKHWDEMEQMLDDEQPVGSWIGAGIGAGMSNGLYRNVFKYASAAAILLLIGTGWYFWQGNNSNIVEDVNKPSATERLEKNAQVEDAKSVILEEIPVEQEGKELEQNKEAVKDGNKDSKKDSKKDGDKKTDKKTDKKPVNKTINKAEGVRGNTNNANRISNSKEQSTTEAIQVKSQKGKQKFDSQNNTKSNTTDDTQKNTDKKDSKEDIRIIEFKKEVESLKEQQKKQEQKKDREVEPVLAQVSPSQTKLKEDNRYLDENEATKSLDSKVDMAFEELVKLDGKFSEISSEKDITDLTVESILPIKIRPLENIFPTLVPKSSKRKTGIGLVASFDVNFTDRLGDSQASYTAGILGNYKLNDKWLLETGVLWSEKSFKTTDLNTPPYVVGNAIGAERKLSILEIPLAVKYIFNKKSRTQVLAGLGHSVYVPLNEKYYFQTDGDVSNLNFSNSYNARSTPSSYESFELNEVRNNNLNPTGSDIFNADESASLMDSNNFGNDIQSIGDVAVLPLAEKSGPLWGIVNLALGVKHRLGKRHSINVEAQYKTSINRRLYDLKIADYAPANHKYYQSLGLRVGWALEL